MTRSLAKAWKLVFILRARSLAVSSRDFGCYQQTWPRHSEDLRRSSNLCPALRSCALARLDKCACLSLLCLQWDSRRCCVYRHTATCIGRLPPSAGSARGTMPMTWPKRWFIWCAACPYDMSNVLISYTTVVRSQERTRHERSKRAPLSNMAAYLRLAFRRFSLTCMVKSAYQGPATSSVDARDHTFRDPRQRPG